MWGKILGGVAGFALGGGPFGAVLGAALGHAAENGGLGKAGLLEGLLGGGRMEGAGGAPGRGQEARGDASRDGMGRSGARGAGGPLPDPAFASPRFSTLFGRREEVFALCVVVLSAKLAKCDGPVNRAEIDAFKSTFRSPPQAARDIARLFDRARENPAGFESYAAELGETHADSPGMLEDVLTGLARIARADRPLTQPELRFLQTVWQNFGLDQAAWGRAMASSQAGSAEQASQAGTKGSYGSSGGSRSRGTPPPRRGPSEDPYDVLGLRRGIPDDEIRARWRGLVRENHPDALASRGAPPERIARASDKVARINAAWDSIKRERGL